MRSRQPRSAIRSLPTRWTPTDRLRPKGGDGLVLARHLWHFGYSPRIFLPKETDKELYKALKTQCLKLSIPQVAAEASDDDAKADAFEKEVASTDVIVDAIFGPPLAPDPRAALLTAASVKGFSFKGSPRPPFARPLSLLTSLTSPVPSASLPTSAHPHPPHTTNPTSPSSSFQPSGSKRPKVISVDIPSSWNVETGPPSRDEGGQEKAYFEPDALVSLTAPKLGSKWFKGRHLLGGRFVPPYVAPFVLPRLVR